MNSTSQHDRRDMRPMLERSNFLIPLLILACGALALAMTTRQLGGADGRGWWPLQLGLFLALYGVYAIFFALIAGLKRLQTGYLIVFNLLLVITHFSLNVLYYFPPIDWEAVRAGSAQLSSLRAFTRDTEVFLCVPVVFLAVHLVIVRSGRLSRLND